MDERAEVLSGATNYVTCFADQQTALMVNPAVSRVLLGFPGFSEGAWEVGLDTVIRTVVTAFVPGS